MLSLLNKKPEKKENYWAILIESNWVASAIWEIENGIVKTIAVSETVRFEDNLVQAVDTALSSCVQKIDEKIPEPEKTVFGLPSSWTTNGEITSENLEKLKKVCEGLSLVPSGFVVLADALAHYLKNEEQVPFSGALLGISDDTLDFSIFNLGKVTNSTNISRSVSVADDLVEGLSRFGLDSSNLPSRIILYNQKETELEEIQNELNSSDWQNFDTVKFIHPPKIEILNSEKKILAVCLAGGVELGDVSGIETENAVEEDINIAPPDTSIAKDLGFEEIEVGQKSKIELSKINVPKINMPKINFKLPRLNGKPVVIGVVSFATFLTAGFIMWWFLPKAGVTVYVLPKKLEEMISIDLSKDLESKEINVSVEGEKTKSTTGIKTVGEKAKGKVEIRNSMGIPVDLPSGTVLTSSSNLKFTTAQSSSVSGQVLVGSPGKSEVDVEASSIGSEYNLSKDEVFKVGSYPQYELAAFSLDNFSGGTSRQISAVSEEDREVLLKQLEDELMDLAKEKLKERLNSKEMMVESTLTKENINEGFSNKVGDEATSLRLSLKFEVKVKIVSSEKLAEIAKNTLEMKIPEGFILRNDQISYDFEGLEKDSRLEARVSANLLPDIDTSEIAKKISGKYPEIAEEYLKSVPGYVRAQFRFKPLPGKLGTLPHVPKNISVGLSAEK
jgi:hypothetical protein